MATYHLGRNDSVTEACKTVATAFSCLINSNTPMCTKETWDVKWVLQNTISKRLSLRAEIYNLSITHCSLYIFSQILNSLVRRIFACGTFSNKGMWQLFLSDPFTTVGKGEFVTQLHIVLKRKKGASCGVSWWNVNNDRAFFRGWQQFNKCPVGRLLLICYPYQIRNNDKLLHNYRALWWPRNKLGKWWM